jgi:hypothetical protein
MFDVPVIRIVGIVAGVSSLAVSAGTVFFPVKEIPSDTSQ